MSDVKASMPPPPSWLNREFVETALRNDANGGKVSVESFTVDYANKERAGFMSSMFRVAAAVRQGDSGKLSTVHLIVKCRDHQGQLQEIIEGNSVFQVEARLLSEFMPLVHDALRAVEGEAIRPLAARCFWSGVQPSEFLVMEDLSEAGFALAAAGRLLDYQHCLTVLRAYARLHAASAKVLQDHPRFMAVYDPCRAADDRQQQLFKEMCDKVFNAVAGALKPCPGYEGYAEKFTRISDQVVKATDQFWTSKDVVLPVILHVDCWKNNFMFKYTEEAVTDVRIVDFQFSKVHSPAADVQCFLSSNSSEQLHRDHFDGLVAEYHAALERALRALGLHRQADAYPLQQLRADMERAAALGLFSSALRGLHLAAEGDADQVGQAFQQSDESGAALTTTYSNPECVSYLKYIAPIYESKGLL